MANRDQPDCKPRHQDVTDKVSLGKRRSLNATHETDDKGCTSPGSSVRRIEAWFVVDPKEGR